MRFTAIFCMLAVALAGGAAAERWDLPSAYSQTSYHIEVAEHFAQLVEQHTGGELQIRVHPGGSLYGGAEIFRAVRSGQVPIGERLISALGNEDALFEVDALPFLATSFADAEALHRAARPVLAQALQERGLALLYTVPWTPQGLYSLRPVARLSDMRGVRFRAYNQMTSNLARAMGAVPTKIETPELSQALATGVAQALISSAATGYDRKIWEQLPYWYDVRAWLPKNMVVANARALDTLPPDVRAGLMRAATAAETHGWQRARERAAWYHDQLVANGMNVTEPGAELSAELQSLGAQMRRDWLRRAGPDGRQMLEAYNTERKRANPR